MNDPDHIVAWFRSDDPQDGLSAYNDAPAAEDQSAGDLTGGPVNLGFFTAALRRSAWVWCFLAGVGLLIGSAWYVKYPPPYRATATVVLVDSKTQDPAVEVLTDQSLAQSAPVASRVVQELKLPLSATSFQTKYTVTIVTDTVLTLEVGAPSSADAVQRAAALATAFLNYRAQYERTQQQQLFAQLDPQYSAAQQRLGVLQGQISQLPTVLSTPRLRAEYDQLQTQIGQQDQVMQYVTQTKLAAQSDTNAMVTGSSVLDPATAVHRSVIKGPALYVGGGLLGGLVAGVAIVVFTALLSRRLRRRDDVAIALRAPVRLSVGPLRPRRWPPAVVRRAAKRRLDFKRVVMYLRSAMPGSPAGLASYAVVAVDDEQVVAQLVVSLAASCAADGERVMIADLSGGHLARLLGVGDPGIHRVSHEGATVVLVLPEPAEVAPIGPLPAEATVPTEASAALVAACARATLLLTLAVLDPAFGGDHLGSWAKDAVAVVTAGGSSAEKIHSVGQMIRLGGTRLDSVVLLGADRGDESTGMIEPAQQPAQSNGSGGAGRRGRHSGPRSPNPADSTQDAIPSS